MSVETVLPHMIPAGFNMALGMGIAWFVFGWRPRS